MSALAVSGSTVYAGGDFTQAGGSAANYIAQWNGSSWAALGSGMNGDVSALAVSGGTLFAGGVFTTAGSDTNANCIAQWNGSSWSALGSGMGGSYPFVYALAVSGSTLYAGGYFTTVGTNVSAYAAMAMRRILIDKARRKRALRHGGDQQRVDIESVDITALADDEELLAVNEALDKLAAQNQVEAELVKLRYFVGMTLEEASEVLGISARTADNYWAHARAWLFREIKAQRQ